MSPDIRIVLTSVDDHKAAQPIAKGLVEAKLAVCVQVSAGGEFWYHWQGKVQHDVEFFLSIKTSAALLGSVLAGLQGKHPYDLPEIVWTPAEASAGYAAWL